MNNKLQAIEKNRTWKLIDLSLGKEAIGLKWVDKSKFNVDGSLQKHKAYLITKRYAQILDIDFSGTFSRIVRTDTIRTISALAT